MRIAQEEMFGPVTTVIAVSSLEEAVEVGNGVRYGLSAAIYTSDVNRAFRAMNDMYTGIFYVNASTIGAEVHLPFGGTKATGNGHRESGSQLLDIFSEWKSVYVDYSGKLQRAQILNSPDDVWSHAEMIVKVKEPIEPEYHRMREGQLLFTYLHLAPDKKLTAELLNRKVTGIAYETITDRRGGLPLLTPMSEF